MRRYQLREQRTILAGPTSVYLPTESKIDVHIQFSSPSRTAGGSRACNTVRCERFNGIVAIRHEDDSPLPRRPSPFAQGDSSHESCQVRSVERFFVVEDAVRPRSYFARDYPVEATKRTIQRNRSDSFLKMISLSRVANNEVVFDDRLVVVRDMDVCAIPSASCSRQVCRGRRAEPP